MTYQRFEDLPVWKQAISLASRVYHLTRNRFVSQPGDLRDQLRRASLSVSNNIAEGFERGSTAELLALLYIARGSAGEVRSMLRFAPTLSDGDSQIADLESEISALIGVAESCSRQIRGWADSLENSDIRGQRHLNDQARRGYEQRRRSEEYRRQSQERFRREHPELFPEDRDDSDAASS